MAVEFDIEQVLDLGGDIVDIRSDGKYLYFLQKGVKEVTDKINELPPHQNSQSQNLQSQPHKNQHSQQNLQSHPLQSQPHKKKVSPSRI